MIDLKCKCTSCKHNSSCNCRAENIEITLGTNCSAYRAKRVGDAEYADEIFEPLVRPSTEVYCNANCMFKHNGICVANGITVGDIHNNATCETFLPQ